MDKLKLYMIMLGASPIGRHTEQHDLFFTISSSLKETVPAIKAFWPEAKDKLHIDAWREVTAVDGYAISIQPKTEQTLEQDHKLFFLNLGGYKVGEFDEFHYKMLIVAPDMAAAIKEAKKSAWYKHTGFKGATSHIDDKYGVDVDDVHHVQEILPPGMSSDYRIVIEPGIDQSAMDEIHLGYFQLHKLQH